MKTTPVKFNKSESKVLSQVTMRGSAVIQDYGYWLMRRYGKAGTYLVNAKTFLKTYKPPSTVISQLDSYAVTKSLTVQSFLRRFRKYLEEKSVYIIINDLNEKRIPIGNGYVKLFIYNIQDRLSGTLSSSTYATVLNNYFNFINQNLDAFNKRSAEKFILAPDRSDYTKRLYKSILKNFCIWALDYQAIPVKELDRVQKKIQKGLKRISSRSLKEIVSIHVPSARNQLKGYHKDSLSAVERTKILKSCSSQRDRAIIALMAWNGLRTMEVPRLIIRDLQLEKSKISIWGKGRSSKSKDTIKLFAVPVGELKKYLKETRIKNGKLFPMLTKLAVDQIVRGYFNKIKLNKRNGKYSPHSLRHTSGQIMYDKGIPLEFIQRTLRHSKLETTLIYAQRAIDRNYFLSMPNNV